MLECGNGGEGIRGSAGAVLTIAMSVRLTLALVLAFFLLASALAFVVMKVLIPALTMWPKE